MAAALTRDCGNDRGATCSGKTTLAKHLRSVLPDSVIIHQDVRVLVYYENGLAKRVRDRTLPPYVSAQADLLLLTPSQPMEKVPVHPVYNVQDWDAAPGAIDWARLVPFLEHIKEAGEIPADHRSHDHLNEQKEVPVPEEVLERWRTAFEELRRTRAEAGERLIWGLVDGFLLYWDKVCGIYNC